MTTLVQEKVAQAIAILQEEDVDCWITFVRESSVGGDPMLDLIYGHDVTWQSAFILTQAGERIAVMGFYDSEPARLSGAYDTVLGYHESIKPELMATLERLNPRQIALNYSKDDVLADGLSYGMYLKLCDYLEGTPFAERLISAQHLVGKLRTRKTPAEIERIRAAVATTEEIYADTFKALRIGITEREMADRMHADVAARGLVTAWEAHGCPIVNAGPDSVVGHTAPSDLQIEAGQIVHFDFGVLQDEYNSDIQRVVYVLGEGETEVPQPVQKGFDTVVAAIQAAVAAMKPGVLGHEIDAIARQTVVKAGYDSYQYATGHHLGRAVHDGGGVVGPTWERYGDMPYRPLEAGHVYTIEPGCAVPGYGYIGIEEDVLVTEDGAVYLGTPQTELVVLEGK